MCKIIIAQCNFCQVKDVVFEDDQVTLCHQCIFDSADKKQMAKFFTTVRKKNPNLWIPCKNREKNNCAGYQGKGMIMYYDKGFAED